MERWIARVLAVVVVIGGAIGGVIVGAFIGNLIVPARLDWSAESGPGLMLVGAFVGMVAGFAFGLWAAMRIVDEARTKGSTPRLPPPPRSR